jgi:(p)ppGpp synthase/HD superfamily hydrolase
MTKVERAQAFAHEAHDSIGQVRKYTKEPYWVHTDEVARIVTQAGGTEDMIIAAHLHDVIEDVYPLDAYYNIEIITSEFGKLAAKYVLELTDEYVKEKYPTLSRRERKELERQRIAQDSPESKTIKLADLISNTRSIVDHDPNFARTYLTEKWALLPYLKEGHAQLWQIAHDKALSGMIQIGLPKPLNPI